MCIRDRLSYLPRQFLSLSQADIGPQIKCNSPALKCDGFLANWPPGAHLKNSPTERLRLRAPPNRMRLEPPDNLIQPPSMPGCLVGSFCAFLLSRSRAQGHFATLGITDDLQ